jgi:hypothetical protein
MNEPVLPPGGKEVVVYLAVVVVWIVVVAVIIGVRAAVYGPDDDGIGMWFAHMMAGFVWPLGIVCYAAYWITKAVMWALKRRAA